MTRELCIPVVMYHCINEALSASPHGRLGFTPGQFRAQLQSLLRRGYELMSVTELWRWLETGAPSETRPAVITFDDGFADSAAVAAPIMADLGARGTVFANPDVTPDDAAPRAPGPWGYLRPADMRRLSEGGTLEIQSHTWDHLRVFTSPEVVDVYQAEDFDRLWWVVWLLRPELRRQWDGDVRRHARAVPDGHPVFASDRHLARPRFEPSSGFVAEFLRAHKSGRSLIGQRDDEGRLESPVDYEKRCRSSLVESKRVLSEWAGRPVEHLCFPGGAYHDRLLAWAGAAGYLSYMRSSRDQDRNDASLVDRVRTGGPRPVGIKRLSFTRDYPVWLQTPRIAGLVATVKLSTLEDRFWARHGNRVARRLRDLVS